MKYSISILWGGGEFIMFCVTVLLFITAFSLNKHTNLDLVTSVSTEL